MELTDIVVTGFALVLTVLIIGFIIIISSINTESLFASSRHSEIVTRLAKQRALDLLDHLRADRDLLQSLLKALLFCVGEPQRMSALRHVAHRFAHHAVLAAKPITTA